MGRPASEWNGRITSSLAKHRNYRLFFLGQLVSLTGTWMQDVALPWLVYHETKSPFAVGLLVFFRFVPFLVLGLFAGVLADGVDNRRLLIATQEEHDAFEASSESAVAALSNGHQHAAPAPVEEGANGKHTPPLERIAGLLEEIEARREAEAHRRS